MRLSLDASRSDFLVFLRRKFGVSKIPIRDDNNGGKIHDGLKQHAGGYLNISTRTNPPLHDEFRQLLGEVIDLSIRDGCFFPDCDYDGTLHWAMVIPARNLRELLGCNSPTDPQLQYQFTGLLAYAGARHACPNHNDYMEAKEIEVRDCEVLRLILTRARDAVRSGLIERDAVPCCNQC